jgi:hypothetical protein
MMHRKHLNLMKMNFSVENQIPNLLPWFHDQFIDLKFLAVSSLFNVLLRIVVLYIRLRRRMLCIYVYAVELILISQDEF